MGRYCQRCGKLMENPNLTHCSDECSLADIKDSKSKDEERGIESWDEKSDPWK